MNNIQTPTMVDTANAVPVLFIGTFLFLGIMGLAVFLSMNTTLKRRWFPRCVVLFCVVFGAFVTLSILANGLNVSTLLFLAISITWIALIAYVNIKNIKFCDCGAILYNKYWFPPMRFCKDCGAALDTRTDGAGEKPRPKFCDCRATRYNQIWFPPMRFCSYCGAALAARTVGAGAKPKPPDDLLN